MAVPLKLALCICSFTFFINYGSSQVIPQDTVWIKQNDLIKGFVNSFETFGTKKQLDKDNFMEYLTGFKEVDQIRRNLNNLKLSQKCENSLLDLFTPALKFIQANDTKGLVQWFLTKSELHYYIDAWAKPPSRLFVGNIAWLGAYDECKQISDSHYCLANTHVLNIPKIHGYFGTCTPKICSANDVHRLLQYIQPFFVGVIDFEERNGSVPLPIHCDDDSSTLPASTIVFITLTCFLAGLCFLGTFMEILQDCFTPDQLVPSPILVNVADGEKEDDSSIHYQRFDTHIERTRGNAVTNFLICFSVIKNTKSILSTHVPTGVVGSLNGIRALSMTWVILGHIYYFGALSSVDNITIAEKISQRFSFQAIANAYVSVDSFFLLSGILVSYITLKKMDNSSGRLGLPMFYIHRFVRLTPSYMFAIFLYSSFYPHIVSGPLGIIVKHTEEPNCKKYWWTNLLYINNIYPSHMMNECLGWSWYLANDMQFYVISPIFLYVMYRFKFRGALLSTGIGILLCVVINGAVIGSKNLPALISESFSPKASQEQKSKTLTFADDVYIKPHTRIAPYLVGLLLGFILSRKIYITRKPHVSIAMFGWTIAFGIGMSVIYGPFTVFKTDGDSFNRTENIFYGAFSRLAWALALGWVIYACHNKMGGIINRFLSWKAWIPLARLTYGAYLLHPIILLFYYNSQGNPFHFQDTTTIFLYISVVVMSYLCSFIMALLIDTPVYNVERSLTKYFAKRNENVI